MSNSYRVMNRGTDHPLGSRKEITLSGIRAALCRSEHFPISISVGAKIREREEKGEVSAR